MNAQGQSDKPLRQRLLPLRIAIIVILIAATGVIVFLELRARGAYNDSMDAARALLQERAGVILYRDNLLPVLEGNYTTAPDGDLDEIFTWSGVLRSYRMRVEYDHPAVRSIVAVGPAD